ncbi:DUF4920 domain-containing protein [Echinicola sp. 20G]|uniref:DUF4920 domain-containing protein n=1 Tax=Echinicola sp. 20G TaxID=2781961 RepID=UPI001910FED3|nr:DUF4920 domain-containing protein [Echinicola sp. 20G]
MKIVTKLFWVLLISVNILACSTKENAHEKVSETDQKETKSDENVAGDYGSELGEGEVTPLSTMISSLEQNETFNGKIEGTIEEVCVKKGCWLTMALPNGEKMRVTFKDYAFFVPTNSQGYPVVLEGEAIRTVTDVKTLRHYAEDGGASKEEIEAIKSPKEEYTFEAIGVVIAEK